MLTLATIVDGEALLDATLASIVAGVAVTLTASTAIYGFATFAEMRREERAGAAMAAAGLALVGILLFTAEIVAGLIVMLKG